MFVSATEWPRRLSVEVLDAWTRALDVIVKSQVSFQMRASGTQLGS